MTPKEIGSHKYGGGTRKLATNVVGGRGGKGVEPPFNHEIEVPISKSEEIDG
jgi:hypothetical protein